MSYTHPLLQSDDVIALIFDMLVYVSIEHSLCSILIVTLSVATETFGVVLQRKSGRYPRNCKENNQQETKTFVRNKSILYSQYGKQMKISVYTE